MRKPNRTDAESAPAASLRRSNGAIRRVYGRPASLIIMGAVRLEAGKSALKFPVFELGR